MIPKQYLLCLVLWCCSIGQIHASELSFVNDDAWCHFHCSSINLYYHEECDEKLSCQNLAMKRRLASSNPQVEVIDFITCANTSTTKVSLEIHPNQTQSVFEDFWTNFQNTIDLMLSGEQPILDSCHLAMLAPNSDQNDSRDEISLPTLVKLERSSDECFCVPKVAELATKDNFTPLISRSDGKREGSTVLLVHVNKEIANQLNALDCVFRVTRMPPLMKLTPLAKSFHVVKGDVGPALRIKLLNESNVNAVKDSLNVMINASCGVLNAIETYANDPNANALKMKSMNDFHTWLLTLTVISRHPNIEWMYLENKIVTNSISMELVAHDIEHRRLDANAAKVVGVTEAQKNGITGNNIVIGVTDTGLYMDHDQFDQNLPRQFNTIDPNARKVVSYQPFGDRYDESENITCGHGTHVSGIVAGSSFSGQSSNLGIASSAKIAFMDIGTQDSTCTGIAGCPVDLNTPGSVNDLLGLQIRAGAKIFSFSWGTPGTDYSEQARDLDRFIYNNPHILIFVAAGNSGDLGPGTISSPSGAKNVVSVGASLNSAASLASTLNCPRIFNENSVASFSSRGPTSDGRLKPDLVTPGQILVSAQSLPPGSTTKTSATCSLQGTSQATPVAAGMGVLIYEWLRDGYWKNGVKDLASGIMKNIPASLIKALLIHSSRGLTARIPRMQGLITCQFVEQRATSLKYPDFNQGYGRPNFDNIMSFATPNTRKVFFLPSNDSNMPTIYHQGIHRYSFKVKKGDAFRVTIAWSDPPGSIGSRVMLQNDLDLLVTIPGTNGVSYYPLSGNGTKDLVNNVEMVEVTYDTLQTASKATSDITVQATITGSSVLINAPQTYSLVASSSSISTEIVPGVNPNSGGTSSGEASSSGFWQPYMTIICIVLGALILLFVLGSVLRRCFRSRRQQTSIPMAVVNTYAGTQTTGSNTRTTLAMNEMNDISTTFVAMPPQGSEEGDRCPYCLFQTTNPVVLVQHVENMHRVGSV